MHRTLALSSLLVVCSPLLAWADEAPPWERGEIDPPWARARAQTTEVLRYDARRSPEQNGNALRAAFGRLRAGARLRIAPGTWSVKGRLALDVRGTAQAPVWVEAFDPRRPPVITRPDAKQNVLNLGEGKRTEFVALRGLHLKGGSSLLRIYDCGNVWIDRCELSEAGAEGITANVKDTDHLFITRNHIHHLLTAKATCEGMYLGANGGKAVMHHSVIASNHVHHMGGTQGDGIEVKQGSYANWIVGNHVHDTRYPAILVYGTAGKAPNRIERNVCYGSKNAALQVQGEALVRNNLLLAEEGAALLSTDHQGKSRELVVVHNTIAGKALGARLNSWSGREGMVFANNLVVSEGRALFFPKGSDGVTLSGNACAGQVQGAAVQGRLPGLQAFVGLDWSGARRDARPRPGALSNGDPAYRVELDLDGDARSKKRVTPGAVELKKKKKAKDKKQKGRKRG